MEGSEASFDLKLGKKALFAVLAIALALHLIFVAYNIFGKNFFWSPIFDVIISSEILIVFEAYSIFLFLYIFLKKFQRKYWIAPLTDIAGVILFAVLTGFMQFFDLPKARYAFLIGSYALMYFAKIISLVLSMKVLLENE